MGRRSYYILKLSDSSQLTLRHIQYQGALQKPFLYKLIPQKFRQGTCRSLLGLLGLLQLTDVRFKSQSGIQSLEIKRS